MAVYSFGSGVLMAARIDVANTTPTPFGLLQEVTIDVKANQKELYGQFQFPVATARGTIKATGKAKVASISGLAYANLFFGINPVAGQYTVAYQEAGSIPTTPFQITVSHAATFVDDFGVTNLATGLPLTKVASAPTTGQYSVVVATGIYTFAAADTGTAVLINYGYTTATATTQKIVVSNQLLGTQPSFQMALYTTYLSKPFVVKIHNATSNSFSLATKLEDFVMPDFEFGFFADSSGNVMTMSFPEIS